ncbi:MAG TPA: prenyltransferase/squalene oxidase repeat-containing protein [Solirubrobacteraceae bacterium]|jgi:prenyltransferase beta subunit|nr:prenyltransferase/squalene oxidase repeat-containing protein [Solirubrobacteraceae bacterium]
MRITRSRLVAALAAASTLLCAAPALANSSPTEINSAINGGVEYLKSQQNADGSFGGVDAFGGEWVLTSLAAAGVAPAGVKHSAGATDARTYYRNLIGDTATWPGGSEPPVSDYETATLAAYAAGIDPARVSATQNLIAQIVAHYQPSTPGYYGEPELFNGTVFALLALADAKTRDGAQRVPQVLLEKTIEVVRHNQHTDGGWSFAKAEGSSEALASPAEAEFTGATIASLCAAGVPSSDPTIQSAIKYLKHELDAEPLGSGAFASEFGVNTDTNAWSVEGLNACGIAAQSTEFTTAHGKTPIDFLISQQLLGGGFQFAPEEGEANLYSTQDAVRALSGAGFTVAPVKAKKQPLWVYEKKFSTSSSVDAQLTLIINNGTSPLGACAVSLAPETPTTTLAKVLEAAESASRPAGCVSAITPVTSRGAITSINGAPNPPGADWEVVIDGGAEKRATRATKIEIGDTIYLRLG